MTPTARRRLQFLIDRAGGQVAAMDRFLADVSYWNDHVRQPHEAVIDADPDGSLAHVRVALCDWMVRGQAIVDAAARGQS